MTSAGRAGRGLGPGPMGEVGRAEGDPGVTHEPSSGDTVRLAEAWCAG